MTVTPTVSLRLSLATQERLRQARQPGESHDALIGRALDALQAHERPQDSPAGSDPHAGLASRVDALQARLGARIAQLEEWRASLAQQPAPPGATHLQHSATQAPAPGVTQPAIQPPQDVTHPVTQDVTQPPGAYPLEVKRLALQMQDQGQPNRVIAAAILAWT